MALIVILLVHAEYTRSNPVGNLSCLTLATYILNYGSKKQQHKSLKIPLVSFPLPNEELATKRVIPSLSTKDPQNTKRCVIISLATPYWDTEKVQITRCPYRWSAAIGIGRSVTR